MSTGTTPVPEQAKPEGLFGSVAVIVVLAAVFGVAVSVIGLKFQGFEARQLFDESFGHLEELPYDFKYAGGTATAGKQRWVRMVRPEAAPPLDTDAPLPEVVLLGRFSGPTAAKRQFQTGFEREAKEIDERREKWSADPAANGDWFARVASGVIQWGGLETDYLQLRRYSSEGTKHDLIRVDVSFGQTGQVLVAHWPNGELDAVNLDVVRPFLASLRFDTIEVSEPAPGQADESATESADESVTGPADESATGASGDV